MEKGGNGGRRQGEDEMEIGGERRGRHGRVEKREGTREKKGEGRRRERGMGNRMMEIERKRMDWKDF